MTPGGGGAAADWEHVQARAQGAGEPRGDSFIPHVPSYLHAFSWLTALPGKHPSGLLISWNPHQPLSLPGSAGLSFSREGD